MLRLLSRWGRWMGHPGTWQHTGSSPPPRNRPGPALFPVYSVSFHRHSHWAAGPISVHLYCPQVDSEGCGGQNEAQVIQVVHGRDGPWINIFGIQITERRGLCQPSLRTQMLLAFIIVSCSATSHERKVKCQAASRRAVLGRESSQGLWFWRLR